MIKKFNDFDKNDFLQRERDSMERELIARKTKRNNIRYNLNINFDFIRKEILSEINNGNEYHISIGKRVEDIENSKKFVFHIEFESERLGRIRIFNPKDTSLKGHYEVNGECYETTAKDVRDFFHLLKQEIKGKSIKESLRGKMTPKSEKEIEDAKDNLIDKCVDFALDYYPERFDDYISTFEWFEVYIDQIVNEYEDGSSVEDIVKGIVDGKW